MASDAEIIAALHQGRTNEDIAMELGACPRRVARLRRQNGNPASTRRGRLLLTPAQDARAHQLRAEGLSWVVIGQRLGVSPKTASEAVKRHAERVA